jgi:hypothetical protein
LESKWVINPWVFKSTRVHGQTGFFTVSMATGWKASEKQEEEAKKALKHQTNVSRTTPTE